MVGAGGDFTRKASLEECPSYSTLTLFRLNPWLNPYFEIFYPNPPLHSAKCHQWLQNSLFLSCLYNVYSSSGLLNFDKSSLTSLTLWHSGSQIELAPKPSFHTSQSLSPSAGREHLSLGSTTQGSQALGKQVPPPPFHAGSE